MSNLNRSDYIKTVKISIKIKVDDCAHPVVTISRRSACIEILRVLHMNSYVSRVVESKSEII